MPPKKVILFDWGGVISRGGTPDEVTVRLEKILGIDQHMVKVLTSPLFAKLKRGMLSIEDFWRELEVITQQEIGENKRDIWAPIETLQPNNRMKNFTDELLTQGYTVGILSNVFPNTEALIRQAGWYQPYSPLFLSSTLGMAKPDAEIYEHASHTLQQPPENIIFIDDQQKCLDPAANIGFHTVLAHHPAQVIHDVRTMLGIL